MHTYIVCVYRARPEDKDSLTGVIEDIESGQKQSFSSIIDLQSKVTLSIGKGQSEFPDLVTQELDTLAPVALAG